MYVMFLWTMVLASFFSRTSLLFEPFLFFSRSSRGSGEKESPSLLLGRFGVLPCIFLKKQGKDDQGPESLCMGMPPFSFRVSRAHAKGLCSRKGVILPFECFLESPFLQPLLRTLLRTLIPSKTLCKIPSTRTGKRGHIKRGLFTGGISRISRMSKFSGISRKLSDSPFFCPDWGLSRISRISKFSRFSRKWTFLKRPLFQKAFFSEPCSQNPS